MVICGGSTTRLSIKHRSRAWNPTWIENIRTFRLATGLEFLQVIETIRIPVVVKGRFHTIGEALTIVWACEDKQFVLNGKLDNMAANILRSSLCLISMFGGLRELFFSDRGGRGVMFELIDSQLLELTDIILVCEDAHVHVEGEYVVRCLESSSIVIELIEVNDKRFDAFWVIG